MQLQVTALFNEESDLIRHSEFDVRPQNLNPRTRLQTP